MYIIIKFNKSIYYNCIYNLDDYDKEIEIDQQLRNSMILSTQCYL